MGGGGRRCDDDCGECGTRAPPRRHGPGAEAPRPCMLKGERRSSRARARKEREKKKRAKKRAVFGRGRGVREDDRTTRLPHFSLSSLLAARRRPSFAAHSPSALLPPHPIPRAHMAAEKPPISFDEEGRVRVLGAAQFRATQELEEEARGFVQSECRRGRGVGVAVGGAGP